MSATDLGQKRFRFTTPFFQFSPPALLTILFWAYTTTFAMATNVPFKPVVLFQGEVQPGSYLHLVDSGIHRFEQSTGISVKRIQLKPSNTGYLAELERAAKDGYSPVIVQDSNAISSFPELAKQYPSVRFISLDVAYHVPNILGITFNHAEGAYIIGYLSGLKTKTNKVGFIGGIDVPVINHFRCGYQLGVKDANPKASVTSRFINNGAYSWDDIDTATKLAKQLLNQDIDVIFPVAGYASLGVVDTIKKQGHGYSFGIDFDYSHDYPNTTLASLEKKVDVAIYAALMQLNKGIWTGNHKQFGVKQNVISVSINQNNPDLTPSDKEKVNQLLVELKGKSSIISQKIDQHCASLL